MNQQWRSQLFNSSAEKSELNSLGFPLSLSRALRILAIAYRTWKRWEELAMTVPEYKLQHIKLTNRAIASGGKAPIVPYQVWVIGKIGEIYAELPDGISIGWMAQEYLNSKKNEFTREAYQQEQARHISMALEA